MVVGVLRLTLALGQARSLKDKRQVVHRVVDRVRARFSVSIAEVDQQDSHKVAVLGVSVVGSEGDKVAAMLETVVRDVESLYLAPVVTHYQRLFRFDDFESPDWGGEGPNPFTREMLAGDSGDDDEDFDGDPSVDDAPWAAPRRPPRRPR